MATADSRRYNLCLTMHDQRGGPGRATQKLLPWRLSPWACCFWRSSPCRSRLLTKVSRFSTRSPSILCLVSLAYQMHIFWMTAFVLAMIEIPDVSGRFQRIYRSVKKIAEKVNNRRRLYVQHRSDGASARRVEARAYRRQQQQMLATLSQVKRPPIRAASGVA